jgi:predicted RecA/RadA family phage recombinase
MAAPYEAEWISGQTRTSDHTPGSAVSAGQVVVVGNTTRVAHRDIPAGTLGTLHDGEGLYDCKAQSSADIAAGVRVFWDNTNNVVTTTATGNLAFGFTAAAIAKDKYGPVRHQPDALPAA